MTAKRALRVALSLIIVIAILAVPVGAGWYLLGQRRAASETGRVNVPSLPLERALIGFYLSSRQDEIQMPAGDDPSIVKFAVEQGETGADIAARLARNGLVSDAGLFRLLLRYHGVSRALEAGEHDLQRTMTMEEVMVELQHGREATMTVTIPEGWRAEQVAERLSRELNLDRTTLMNLVSRGEFDYAFLRDHPEGVSLEGYLFPDTYQITADAAPTDVIGLMLHTFGERFTQKLRDEAQAMGLTVHEVVTLASIVEREAQVPAERGPIASVFLNRLQAGMKLDADPTVQYALGYQADSETWWKVPLLLQDLEVNSPYNTYKSRGLPPGPICNPGLASLQAVVRAPDTDYFYFVVNQQANDGSHVFAETLDEHLQNQSQYGRQN